MTEAGLGRRTFLTAGAMAAGAALSGRAFAEDHSAHHAGSRADAALVKSALDCVETGEICLAHCLEEFRAGRTGLGDCAVSVQEMLAACGAVARLSAIGSKQLPAFAAATAAVCESCEAACRKHEKEHEICRRCAEACAACRKECLRVASASVPPAR